VLGDRAASLSGDGDEVERPVELAVASAAESAASLWQRPGCDHAR
jgi:hypothetical protein